MDLPAGYYKSWLNRLPNSNDPLRNKITKYTKLVKLWKPQDDVWYMKYNPQILSSITTFSAIYIGWRWRKFFKLADGKTAIFNSYVPIVAVPMAFSPALYTLGITLPLLTRENNCIICANLRASLIQLTLSTIYPTFCGAITSWYFGNYFNTYAFPDDIKTKSSRKYIFNEIKRGMKRNRLKITLVGIINIMIILFLADRERESFYLMINRIRLENQPSKQNK